MHALLWLVALNAGTPAAQQSDSASMAQTLSRWVSEHRAAGMAVGVLDRGHRMVAVAGNARAGSARIDDATDFEIGSITKVFTGTLLANMVLHHEVALDDPVAKYLPGWTIPSYQGHAITLLDLATQSSGLPRLPDLHPANVDDPYADFDAAALQHFLAGYALTRAPGAQYEYSNLGVGLLGFVLARRLGVSYQRAIAQRVLIPLGMSHSSITGGLGTSLVAEGHTTAFDVTPPWHFDALQGAGALHATLADLLRFVAAVLDTTQGPLQHEMAFATRPRRSIGGADSIGLAWHFAYGDSVQLVWHNGGTGGFRSWLSVDRRRQRAVVALSNDASAPLDAIGRALQMGQPLPDPPVQRAAVALAPTVRARVVGRYQLAPEFFIEISETDGALFEQATGQRKLPIFAASDSIFFLRAVDAELRFQSDSAGKVTGVVLRQNGRDQPARRVP
jgi:D-alanyl-D-alanine-carboxypeptidase/D-alanyl-D-alanine-endopeptidase